MSEIEENPGYSAELAKGPQPQNAPLSPPPEDMFDKINISFFIEEFYLQILESFQATAGLAYLASQWNNFYFFAFWSYKLSLKFEEAMVSV